MLHTTPDPRTEPAEFRDGLAPATARPAIARQLARRNAREREQAEAAALGQWCREHGPQRNAQGLYAPKDAR